MHVPGLIIAATAIVLGVSSGAVAEEITTSAVSPSNVYPNEQTFAKTSDVLPSNEGLTDAALSSSVIVPSLSVAVPRGTHPVVTVESALQPPITIAQSVAPAAKTASTADAEMATPATSLNGTIAADVSGISSKCPLKVEMVALSPEQVAQVTKDGPCPRPAAIAPLIIPEPFKAEASPALSIYIPVGYGLDGWSVWGSGNYQAGVREDTGGVGGGGLGVGLGDAKKAVGLELGYTFIDSDSFGEGGFSGKLHRRVGDNASIAFGWNGFGNIGRNDFEQSIYGVATYVFRLADSLDSPFSRIALTVGAGNGQFRTNTDRDNFENGTGIFGNLAFRVIRPVSLIAEWTSQDLAVGLSIAPFKNLPFVITPAVRDVTGSGYEPRFVIGAGVSFKF